MTKLRANQNHKHDCFESATKQTQKGDLMNNFICPDCKNEVRLNAKKLVCTGCNRVFNWDTSVIEMLPKKLEKNYEDIAWKTLPYEGIKKPAWMALLHKKDRIMYFYERILPKVNFNGKVLEVGAGTCWVSALIKKKHQNSLVVASDVSPYALEKGQKISSILESTVDYTIACDVKSLPFSDEYFDVVLSNATIHHFPDPQRGVCEMYRVLKKGGKCYALGEVAAGIPFKTILTSQIGFAGKRAKSLEIEEKIYSLTQWKRFFETSGFSEITVEFDKTWKHKLYNLFVALYYVGLSYIPNILIGNFLPCNIDFYATKTNSFALPYLDKIQQYRTPKEVNNS
ncbi:MAG: methyltransferase domain-containing protein [Candidatus Bathyarchaeota archaeon]|nr:methyltransferase domain-containing protein [Candidatus Bathyarchaeum sp.]